ncbi:MAG: right-handed parallel beta-helix repeat-containing protein [bacterium]|nr:right-handed parallel beta-helix repeat-containing protein [bacterium]
MSKFNKILLLFVNVVIVIVIVIVIVAIANAWTNPTANPPGGGGTLYYYNGNVGIGTAIPTAALTLGADESLRLIGGTAFPASPNEGEIFFKSDTKQLYTYANSAWQADRTVAGKIVAASNSLNKEKADYVCDGADDQVEIQAAIDALGANGGTVYLSEGTFNISTSINLDNVAPDDSGKAIIGAGAGTVLKITTGASNVNVINASGVNRILISQLMIDGNNKTGSGNSGIRVGIYSRIDKVWVENMSYNGINCGSNNIITGNTVSGNGINGIQAAGSNNNIITGNTLSGNRQGIMVHAYSTNNTISDNIVMGNTHTGMVLYASPTPNTRNNIVTGNIVSGNGWAGIEIRYASYNTITGNVVQGNGMYGIRSDNYASYNTIAGNTVSGNGWDGIMLEGHSSNNTVTGNNIYDNGGTGNYNGIRMDSSNNSNNLISSNRIFDSSGTGYGINISANTCDNNYIVGNLIDGTGFTAPIQDLGTGTKYTQKEKITIERQTAAAPTAGSTLDASANPKSYVPLAPTSAVTLNATTAIADGKSSGDMLILEGTSDTNTVTIPHNANTILSGASSKTLGLEDILKLLWNGSDWVEIAYSNN